MANKIKKRCYASSTTKSIKNKSKLHTGLLDGPANKGACCKPEYLTYVKGESSKSLLILCCVVLSLLGMEPSPVTPLDKTNFSFARDCQLEIDSGLGMWVCVHFPSQC